MRMTVLALGALALSAPTLAASVEWGSKPADSANQSGSMAVLGQPDGIATSISFFASSYVRDFKPGKVNAAQIEKLLKLPAGELAKWDVIAFESKSLNAPGQGFDSSMWRAWVACTP